MLVVIAEWNRILQAATGTSPIPPRPTAMTVQVPRPILRSGDTWTYHKCLSPRSRGIAFETQFLLVYDETWERFEVLGAGDYLGFRDVYTIRYTASPFLNRAAFHGVYDRDLNLLASYNPTNGRILRRFEGRLYRWPPSDGKRWAFEASSEDSGGQNRRISRGEGAVTAVSFEGRSYVQLELRETIRYVDREETTVDISIWDVNGTRVAWTSTPGLTRGGRWVSNAKLACLYRHPINNYVDR